MTQSNPSEEARAEQLALRTENAHLRIALRQAQDFCVEKEKKSIEYIFHLGQYKSRLTSRLNAWLSLFFNAPRESDKTQVSTLEDEDALYADWLAQFEQLDAETHRKISKHIQLFLEPARFTLILDCRNAEASEIERSLTSLDNQIYQNFDLLLCGREETLLPLTRQRATASGDTRKIIPLSSSACERELLEALASEILCDYVALFAAGDQLHATALYEFAAEIDLSPQAQALYADEDLCDETQKRRAPFFKPDWNRELFLGQNYTGALCFIEHSKFSALIRQKQKIATIEALHFYALLGSPREAVRHIPAALYHRRASQCGVAWTRRSQALTQQYLDASGVRGEAGALADHPEWVAVRRGALDPAPLVTIIIPTRNRPDLLSVSLRGVLSETDYKNIEVIIVDHENDHPEVIEIFKAYANDARVTVLPYSGVFDHSDMNNRAATLARGEILLFLNDDIEVIEPDWLTHMIAQFALTDRGVVGARLLYPDRRIQHAGVILGLGGVAGHGSVKLAADAAGYYGRLKIACEVSALTGACMAMRRALFEEVGGFSARHLQRTFNDVDLCLKARAKGKVNIYTPLATLVHHESATDGGDVQLKHYKRLQGEVGYMLETWGLMRSDPYYNVNLSLEGKSFALAFPPRRVAPWQAAGVS